MRFKQKKNEKKKAADQTQTYAGSVTPQCTSISAAVEVAHMQCTVGMHIHSFPLSGAHIQEYPVCIWCFYEFYIVLTRVTACFFFFPLKFWKYFGSLFLIAVLNYLRGKAGKLAVNKETWWDAEESDLITELRGKCDKHTGKESGGWGL